MARGRNWIAGAIEHPGALRKTAKVRKGHKIPVRKLDKLANEGGVTGRRARLALTMRGFNRG